MSGWVWIRQVDELASLRADWQRLWLEAPNTTPFQSPAWLLNYLDVFPPDGLLAAPGFDGSKLVGLLVGEILRNPVRGRTYHFLGEHRSDYLDGSLAPGRPPEMLIELASHLEVLHQNGIDFELAQLPPDSELLSLS